MMKPKAQTEHEDGMLEFLEDIIGSSRFKLPIDQLTKRVEILNDLRGEKVQNLKSYNFNRLFHNLEKNVIFQNAHLGPGLIT